MDKKEGDDRNIAVYDLGGGTFDISIIEIAEVDGEHQFEVLSTNGDTFLGGEDFDQRLDRFLADEFAKSSRHQPAQRSARAAASERSRREGEDRAVLQPADRSRICRTLRRTRPARSISTSSSPAPSSRRWSRSWSQKTIEPCRIALKDAGLTVNDVSEVILVGGQTRMPLVQK